MTGSATVSLLRPEPLGPHEHGRLLAATRTAGDRHRILVSDFESQSLRALRVVFQGADLEVHASRAAAQALDRSALCRPEAATIELELPDGGAVELCRGLREWSAMPVLMLSAVCDEEER